MNKKELIMEAIEETREQMKEVEKLIKDKSTFTFMYGKKLSENMKIRGLDNEADLLKQSLTEILMR